MGRRSMVQERRAEILRALEDVVREEGYEAATLERVAARAGVQRTLIRHYFGNRDALIDAALVHITGKYQRDCEEEIARFAGERTAEALVGYLFGGAFNQRSDDDAVIDALIVASGRSEAARVSVLRMYTTFEDVVVALLRGALPGASEDGLRDVAYALVCLAEQHSMMRALGIGVSREAAIRRAALSLIGSIAPKPVGTRGCPGSGADAVRGRCDTDTSERGAKTIRARRKP